MSRTCTVDMMFVVLCYKNTSDIVNLLECLKNIQSNYKVIIVNSFYDDASENSIKRTATAYNCDFLSIPNKGYGFGNNLGVEYALKNYQFSYLCICNPDILFDGDISITDTREKPCIIAPKIITINGKKQNPYYAYRCRLVETLKEFSSKKRSKLLYYLAVLAVKIAKLLTRVKSGQRIYACHGACLFIEHDAVLKLLPLFNDEMFLFNEEEHLARKAEISDIPIIYSPEISVVHNENGSSDELITSGKELDSIFDSYRVLAEYWKCKAK